MISLFFIHIDTLHSGGNPMDISNINAANAYTTNESVKPPVDSTLLKGQDPKIPEADLNQKTERQPAFEVDITREAQDRLAAQTTQPSMGTPISDKDSDDASGRSQSPATAQEARQIVNIVA
jgi:hypothetical protein